MNSKEKYSTNKRKCHDRDRKYHKTIKITYGINYSIYELTRENSQIKCLTTWICYIKMLHGPCVKHAQMAVFTKSRGNGGKMADLKLTYS